MNLYVVGSPGKSRDALAGMLGGVLPDIFIHCMDLDGLPRHRSREPAAAFVLVNNMHGLQCLRKIAEMYRAPVVVVSSSPDYALEGIRCDVQDYIIPPIWENDLRQALRRLGIACEKGDAHAHIDTG